MFYQTLLALCSLLATSALASTPVLQGTLSRANCVDDGNPFSQGTCRFSSKGIRRGCTVQQRVNKDGSLAFVQIQIPNRVVRAHLKGAYLFNSEGAAYMATVDNKTSVEIMADTNTGLVTKANIYADHVESKKGSRTTRSYTQYSCNHLRVVR